MNSVLIVSGGQQRDSAMDIHVSILPQHTNIFFIIYFCPLILTFIKDSYLHNYCYYFCLVIIFLFPSFLLCLIIGIIL